MCTLRQWRTCEKWSLVDLTKVADFNDPLPPGDDQPAELPVMLYGSSRNHKPRF